MTYSEGQKKAFGEYLKLHVHELEIDQIREGMSKGSNQIIDAFIAGYDAGAHAVYYATEKSTREAYHTKMEDFRK